MKDKRLKVIKKVTEVILIIVFVASIFLALNYFFSINAFAAGPGGSGDTSGGFGSDDLPSSTTQSFVPPQTPSYEEYTEIFGIPLVYNRSTQVTDFFDEPSINIEALLYTNDRGYIINQMSYVSDISGQSYYFEFVYADLDESATITFNSSDEFLLYVFVTDEFVEAITPDVELMFNTYFYNMSLGAYIGFVNYFENYAVPQYEVYYNSVLNKLGSTQYGQNMLLSIITAPYNVLDSFTLFEANGVNISLWNVLITCIGIAMFIWFIKMFAGG